MLGNDKPIKSHRIVLPFDDAIDVLRFDYHAHLRSPEREDLVERAIIEGRTPTRFIVKALAEDELHALEQRVAGSLDYSQNGGELYDARLGRAAFWEGCIGMENWAEPGDAIDLTNPVVRKRVEPFLSRRVRGSVGNAVIAISTGAVVRPGDVDEKKSSSPGSTTGEGDSNT